MTARYLIQFRCPVHPWMLWIVSYTQPSLQTKVKVATVYLIHIVTVSMFDHLRITNHVPDCHPFKLLNFNSIMVFHRSGKIDPGAQPSVIATLDFSTVGNYNRIMLFNVLNTALNRGNLGSLSVSPIGFNFRPITGKVYCFFRGFLEIEICCGKFDRYAISYKFKQ